MTFLLPSGIKGLRSETIFGNWESFKNDEKYLFHLKRFSRSQDVQICLGILVLYKNGLIRTIRVISKLIMSQPGKQTIAIHTLPNLSRSKGSQTMKFDQLIECKGKDTLSKFSFRAFHQIQFQGHFMKHEILSWSTFALISKFHCVCFSSIKKIAFTEKRCLLTAKN